MPKVYAFYNPLAGNGSCKNDAHFLDLIYDEEILYCDLTKPETYERQLFALQKGDRLVLCGGDGTLNRFFNLVPPASIPCDIFYFPLGSRNGFAQSLHKPFGCAPFAIAHQLEQLPQVTIGQRQICFFHQIYWHSPKALSITVTVDGKSSSFKRTRQASLRYDFKDQKLKLQIIEGNCCLFAKSRQKQSLLLYGDHISIQFSQATTVLLDGDPIDDTSSCTATIGMR